MMIWTIFAALVSACALLPPVLAVRLACDRLEDARPGAVVRDARFAAALFGSVLSESALLLLIAGDTVAVRLCAGLFRRTVTYQTLTRGCAALFVSALCAVAIGDGIRAAFFRARHAYPNVTTGAYLRSLVGRRSSRSKKRAFAEPVSRRCRSFVLLACSLAALVLLAGAGVGTDGVKQLLITEVCRKQSGMDADESWFELYNDGFLPCEAEGLYLSNDAKALRQFALHMTVPAQGQARQTARDVEFVQIRREGGTTLYLSDRYGKVLDSAVLPALEPDMVCTREGEAWTLRSIAPAQTEEVVSAPVFSAPGGFYDEEFSLTLSADADCEIYYTLDCSEPTAESTHYDGAIRVFDRSSEPNVYRAVQNVQRDYLDKEPVGTEPVPKAFVVRAVARSADGALSPVVTMTYFVGQDAYRDDTVLSLVADPDELFGPDGIYVLGPAYEQWYAEKTAALARGETFESDDLAPTPNYKQKGPDSERAANLEMLRAAEPIMNQKVGVRIQGNNARELVLKRFSVYARRMYGGSSLFDAPVFAGHETHSFVLREGLTNAVGSALCAGRSVAVQPVQKVTVFLNGEFWYETFLQEKYSENLLAQIYGVRKDDVELLKIGTWDGADAETREAYQAFLDDVAARDLSRAEEYAALERTVDVQSYIDSVCLNVYLANMDSHEKLNTVVWRTKLDEMTPSGDGRWHWGMFDLDLKHGYTKGLYGYETSAEINSFRDASHEDLKRYPKLLEGGVLWESLRRSEQFNRQFVLSFMDIVNTTFAPERVEEILRAFGTDMDFEDGFFRDRTAYVTRFLAEEFGLTGTLETLTVRGDPEAGTVTVNTAAPDLTGGAWSGQYFTDYPVTLTAAPAAGHRFVCWRVDGEEITTPSVEVTLAKGGSEVYAIFA